MLVNIKSIFILRKIFNNINEMAKLNLVVHNKTMQHKLDIEIIDYRRISSRYITSESKGKGKEYDSYNNKLIYEGEYLNGKRHGLGKQYNDKGKLKYEGEYFNGKMNGSGKEYYENGRLKYDGEYLNGKRHGKGKEYDENGKLKFEGDYINGKKITN